MLAASRAAAIPQRRDLNSDPKLALTMINVHPDGLQRDAGLGVVAHNTLVWAAAKKGLL